MGKKKKPYRKILTNSLKQAIYPHYKRYLPDANWMPVAVTVNQQP